MDLGFHHCISGAMMAQVAAEEGRQQSVQVGLDQMAATVAALDSRLDKQRFLESNHTAFMIPKKFEVQGTRTDDEVSSILLGKCANGCPIGIFMHKNVFKTSLNFYAWF